jgi:hypothetical protein
LRRISSRSCLPTTSKLCSHLKALHGFIKAKTFRPQQYEINGSYSGTRTYTKTLKWHTDFVRKETPVPPSMYEVPIVPFFSFEMLCQVRPRHGDFAAVDDRFVPRSWPGSERPSGVHVRALPRFGAGTRQIARLSAPRAHLVSPPPLPHGNMGAVAGRATHRAGTRSWGTWSWPSPSRPKPKLIRPWHHPLSVPGDFSATPPRGTGRRAGSAPRITAASASPRAARRRIASRASVNVLTTSGWPWARDRRPALHLYAPNAMG